MSNWLSLLLAAPLVLLILVLLVSASRHLVDALISQLFESPYIPRQWPSRPHSAAPRQLQARLLAWLPRVGTWHLMAVLAGLSCLWLLSGCGTPRSSPADASLTTGLQPLPAELMQRPASPVPLIPMPRASSAPA